MPVYRNTYIGRDEEGATDQQVTRDGLVIFPHIGYSEAIKWVKDILQPGDTYEEEEDDKVYCVQSYEEFVAVQEAVRRFDAGE